MNIFSIFKKTKKIEKLPEPDNQFTETELSEISYALRYVNCSRCFTKDKDTGREGFTHDQDRFLLYNLEMKIIKMKNEALMKRMNELPEQTDSSTLKTNI